MSRKASRQQVGVALFPFLAVLICTMGALIVLLVLLVQQARVDASTIAAQQSAAARRAAITSRFASDWKTPSGSASCSKRAGRRKQRSWPTRGPDWLTWKSTSQRLEAQARELMERARSIDEGKKLRGEDLAAARAEAARLKAEIEKKKKELDEAKKKNRDGQEWYALIPYDGRSGTRRRPIYIECTEIGVIIQPEGMLLRRKISPDRSARAIRSTLRYGPFESTSNGPPGDKAGQPYPLLVVRPGGILAYTAAKAAMKAWDDEFGYELISDEKQLDFGPPDPALADTLEQDGCRCPPTAGRDYRHDAAALSG